MIKGVKNHVTKTWEGCKLLSKTTHRSAVSLLAEFFYTYIRYGCLPRQFFIGNFWNKTSNDRKDILTYRRICKIMSLVNKPEGIPMLENKALFNKEFADYVHREWLLSSESTPKAIAEFILRHGMVIVKPVDDMEGHGIYRLDANNVNIKEESEKLVLQKMMIEEILVQHPKMVFGNTCVNTIRVHTMLDGKGKAHVVSCIMRAGVGDTVMDNYCAGGVIYPVDIEEGIVIGPGKSRVGNRHFRHPQTDIVMLGYQIPNWHKVINETEAAAERIPNVRLIGWDVAVTKNGIALIEGNHNPDYELFEYIGDGNAYKVLKGYL